VLSGFDKEGWLDGDSSIVDFAIVFRKSRITFGPKSLDFPVANDFLLKIHTDHAVGWKATRGPAVRDIEALVVLFSQRNFREIPPHPCNRKSVKKDQSKATA